VLVFAGFLVGCSPIPAPPQEASKAGLASVTSSDARAQESPWIDVLNELVSQPWKRPEYEPAVILRKQPTWIEVDPVRHGRDWQPRYETSPLPWKRRDCEPVVILGNLDWIPIPQYGAIANWGTRNEKR